MAYSNRIECLSVLQIDETCEFSAPRFFDFIHGETEDEMRDAELLFDRNLSYAPSRMCFLSFYSSFFFLKSFLWKIKSICLFLKGLTYFLSEFLFFPICLLSVLFEREMAYSNGIECLRVLQIDENCEFSAPHFVDFIHGETEEEMHDSELWFDRTLSYAPSPFMPRLKLGRSTPVLIESLCDFKEVEKTQPAETSTSDIRDVSLAPAETCPLHVLVEPVATEVGTEETHKQEEKESRMGLKVNAANKEAANPVSVPSSLSTVPVPRMDLKVNAVNNEAANPVSVPSSLSTVPAPRMGLKVNAANNEAANPVSVPSSLSTVPVSDREEIACTPKAQIISAKQVPLPTTSKNQTAKSIASLIKKTSANKPRNQSPLSRAKSVKQQTIGRSRIVAKNTVATDIAQEHQAIKRQKLEEGRSRHILNIKDGILPHKSKVGCGGEKRYELSTRKDSASPFVSVAEMVRNFQTKTREMGMSHNRGSLSYNDGGSIIQQRPMLKLTRPKEPNLETAQRVRAVRIKSSAEIEEDMLAKIPKFKAKPVNKKMLEAPSLPALPRSTPQLPEFKEFNLKTMERASQHAGTSSTTEIQTKPKKTEDTSLHKLTEPRPPRLETLLRARPPKAKSSQELELEELEKIPKFKARPLNKKIFESKGDLGVFCNLKRQMTTPQAFHFATDERIKPANDGLQFDFITTVDLFDKLSINSESRSDQLIPKLTTPNPFHLHTEERGLEKERKFIAEVLQQQLEEEKARIPKANPYPYTTDYPVIPPKPEPKECTKPEGFQLASLVRHEEELQRIAEEREKLEKEAAEMRVFKAQPIIRSDPLPVPEKLRKPLTEVQEFALHVDHRALDRAEFDKKVKDKEMMYKRYRDEFETAKMMEEEKAVKQMRRTMVPHARPLPSFDNPFLPQRSSKECTKPKSPNLHAIRRSEKRRTTTGTATHIR